MDRARISVDFNELDNPMPISKTDEVIDSDGNTITLSEGLSVFIYEEDYDEFDRKDYLIADGIVVRNPNKESIAKWCCQIDERGVRHESDNPDFCLSALTVNEKRQIIYDKMEKQLSKMGQRNSDIVQCALETYIKILKRIDAEEL